MNKFPGIRKYTISDLRAISVEDRWAVRDEVLRRHEKAAKRLAKWKKECEELEALSREVM